MIHHALKLMWNQKRQNALILLELVGSFLVLVALSTSILGAYESWQRPVGFKPTDLWTLRAESGGPEKPPADTGRRLLEASREHPAVLEAGLMYFGLYTQSGLRTSSTEGGRFLLAEHVPASPEIGRILGLELEEGRFFGPQDRTQTAVPVVINRVLAESFFEPGVAVVDQNFTIGEQVYRVVGVVTSFRKGGELASEEALFFSPLWPDETLRFGLATVALRMRPGTPAREQEQLIARVRAELPTWSFDIQSVVDQKRAHLEKGITPLATGAVVAVFLLVMVGLGLTGVLWQNISKRTPEIGLRRAQGATARDIRRQIGLELAVLTWVSILVGGIVAVQLPLLDIVDVRASVAAQAFALSSVILVLLSAVCGLYPSWLASRIQPAQALHHT